MDNKFEKAITLFKAAPTDQMIEAVYRIFYAIATLTLEEVVAAKNTLVLFQTTHSLNSEEEEVVMEFRRALRKRCKALWELERPRPVFSNEAKWNYMYALITDAYGADFISE